MMRDSSPYQRERRHMAYWTKTDEEPDVYHTYDDCSEGKKILPENREEGDPPSNRELCEVCAAR
jgi:hypothetical protein